MTTKNIGKTLAELARTYRDTNPAERPEPLSGSERPWDFAVDSLADEIEKLRRRFPLERVQRAAQELDYNLAPEMTVQLTASEARRYKQASAGDG